VNVPVNQSTARRGSPRREFFDKASPSKLYKPTYAIAGCGKLLAGDALGMESWHEILCVCNRDGFDRGRLPYFAFPARMKEWVARITAISTGICARSVWR